MSNYGKNGSRKYRNKKHVGKSKKSVKKLTVNVSTDGINNRNSLGVAPKSTHETTIGVQKGLSPFPQRYKVKLCYALNVVATAPANTGLFGDTQFLLNSCHDPDLTGTGHQPRWWDQVKAYYAQYRVDKCKYDLQFSNPQKQGCYGALTIRGDNDANNYMNGKAIDFIMEQSGCEVFPLSVSNDQVIRKKGTVQIWKAIGAPSKTEYESEQSYSAIVSSDPAAKCVLDLGICDPNLSITATPVRIIGMLTYYVELFDYIGVGQS